MKLNLLLISSTIAALSAAGMACAATVTVSGDSDIFAAGLGTAPGSTNGGGSLPPSIPVVGGETLLITAKGLVNCCDTAGFPGTSGPNGFTGNPFGGSGSAITNSTGSFVGEFTDLTGAFPLAGVFNGGTETPFTVGTSDTVVVPVGATLLYFGLPDAAGFNGSSGYYSDNSGSFTVNIAAVPEPASWATMLFGVGMVGAGLRMNRRRGTLGLTAA
jgi:hypothetical protein